MRGIKLLQWLFGRRIRHESQRNLTALASVSQRQQETLAAELKRLGESADTVIEIGTTAWQQAVQLPAREIANHSLIVGASGSGKSFLALHLICCLLEQWRATPPIAFGILDAKGELFERALSYVYAFLYRLPPEDRERFKQRVITIDFASPRAVTPYNILASQHHLADEIMVANRIDTISEQFAGLSEMSVRMKMILKYFLLLMTEFKLPLPLFEKLCSDPVLLDALVERSANLQVKDYFLHRFDDESKATLLALRQRLESLFICESVRLSLSAPTAPDFTTLQDGGSIVLINTAGHNISRGVSQLLQNLLLSDIKQSVFRRTNVRQRVVWFLDEAQEIYKSRVNKEHMVDLLTMARSFGSYFALITQSLTSAVRDADVLNSILTNVRWLVMLRSTLRDAELLAPGLALTGRMIKPGQNPFEPVKHLTESEELKAKLKEITRLPDRAAYCWLKAFTDKAVKMTTPLVPLPHELAGCSQEAFADYMKSEPIGQGVTKEEIMKIVAERQQHLRRMVRPAAPQKTAGVTREPRKQEKRALVNRLEDAYSKRQEKQ